MNQQMTAAKQVMDFQKAAFDGVFTGFQMLWSQTELVVQTLFSMNPWIPEEGRKVVMRWIDSNKDSFEHFKNLVDTGYSNLQTSYSGMQAMESTAGAARAATAPVRNIAEATPVKDVAESTPLQPVADMLLGEQQEQQQNQESQQSQG